MIVLTVFTPPFVLFKNDSSQISLKNVLKLAVFNHFWCYLSACLHECLLPLRSFEHQSHAAVMNSVHCSLHPTCHYHFFVLTGSQHLWWSFFLLVFSTIFAVRLKVFHKWTGGPCNHVALVFTGCCCSLWGDMSPHWKWSASILSAHFFLIRWFVSLGNWSQPQLHCLWKFNPATYPFLCGKIPHE